jgi:hypothetical protein
MFISFIFLSLTGIMLFLCPQGRVAYWSGWRMFGLSKDDYGQLHTTFMVLFLVTGITHIVLNWKPIVNYLKDRKKKVRIFTKESVVALVLATLFFVGTLGGAFPFQQFLNVGDDIKGYWERTEGSPPWGHAELNPLDRFCRGLEDFERIENERYVTIDPEEALTKLRESGIRVENVRQPLIEIAEVNSTTPQALAEVILLAARPAQPGEEKAESKEQEGPYKLPYSGLGRMTLREYAEKYNLDVDEMVSILRGLQVEIDADKKLKDEATRLGTDPEGIVELLNQRR